LGIAPQEREKPSKPKEKLNGINTKKKHASTKNPEAQPKRLSQKEGGIHCGLIQKDSKKD